MVCALRCTMPYNGIKIHIRVICCSLIFTYKHTHSLVSFRIFSFFRPFVLEFLWVCRLHSVTWLVGGARWPFYCKVESKSFHFRVRRYSHSLRRVRFVYDEWTYPISANHTAHTLTNDIRGYVKVSMHWVLLRERQTDAISFLHFSFQHNTH